MVLQVLCFSGTALNVLGQNTVPKGKGREADLHTQSGGHHPLNSTHALL